MRNIILYDVSIRNIILHFVSMRNKILYIIFAFALTSCGTTHLIVDDGVYTPVPTTTTVVYKYNYAPWIYAPHKYVYHPSYSRFYNRSFLTKPYDPKRRPSYSKPSPKPDKPRPSKLHKQRRSKR